MLAFLFPFAILVGALALTRRSQASVPALPAPAPMVGLSTPTAPSPIAVLCVFLRRGNEPPVVVVQCAIAEAQILGRHDLVHDLIEAFGHRLPPEAQPVQPSRASSPSQSPTTSTAPASPPAQATPAQPMSTPASAPASAPAPPSAPAAGPVQAPGPIASQPAVDQASPIQGVPDDAWSHFCGQLVRESPTFASQRHVGRYRHRKDRLAEIGFDPDMLAGSPDIQDTALSADLNDAFNHMIASGMTGEIGRPISLPDVEGQVALTLSGMLGIAAVAGLEGCAGWLENKEDRKRFPHTTQAFLRTNGVF